MKTENVTLKKQNLEVKRVKIEAKMKEIEKQKLALKNKIRGVQYEKEKLIKQNEVSTKKLKQIKMVNLSLNLKDRVFFFNSFKDLALSKSNCLSFIQI